MTALEIVLYLFLLLLYLRYFSPIIITYKLHHELAQKPTKAYGKSACWDVYSVVDVTVPSGEWREVDLGISFAPWPHIYMSVFNFTFTPLGNVAYKMHSRSGLAIKRGIRNHLGIIDNDYREIMSVIVFNHGINPARFKPGHKVGQLEFFRVPKILFWRKNKLSKSWRGKRGFGSTGK